MQCRSQWLYRSLNSCLALAQTTRTEQAGERGPGFTEAEVRELEAVGVTFRRIYAVFASRAWDRLYLVLGLLWSILCAGHMDGALPGLGHEQLGLVPLSMFVLAITPTVSALASKAFCSSSLRPCLRKSGTSAVSTSGASTRHHRRGNYNNAICIGYETPEKPPSCRSLSHSSSLSCWRVYASTTADGHVIYVRRRSAHRPWAQA